MRGCGHAGALLAADTEGVLDDLAPFAEFAPLRQRTAQDGPRQNTTVVIAARIGELDRGARVADRRAIAGAVVVLRALHQQLELLGLGRSRERRQD